MPDAVCHFGMPIFSENKLEQRKFLFSEKTNYYFLTNYITSRDHRNFYLLSDAQKVKISEKLKSDNITWFNPFDLLTFQARQFRQAFDKLRENQNEDYNFFMLLYNSQEVFNEYSFYLNFFNKILEDFDNYIFISTSYCINDLDSFNEKILSKNNWIISQFGKYEEAKSVWSVSLDRKGFILDLTDEVNDWYTKDKIIDVNSERFRKFFFDKHNFNFLPDYNWVCKQKSSDILEQQGSRCIDKMIYDENVI